MSNDTEVSSDDYPDPLTDSWIAFVQAPGEASAQNRFATELNEQVRKFLSRVSMISPLKSLSDDLCQEACLLLFSNLLAGNKDLVAATRAGHRTLIAGELRRSVSAALRFSRWKLLKKLSDVPDQIQSEKARREDASSQHPANFTAVRELSIEAQQKLVMDVLCNAVRNFNLTPGNAELARALIENNITQADLAKSLGVTRQALHQRLNPVWRFLRKAIDDEEFPLS